MAPVKYAIVNAFVPVSEPSARESGNPAAVILLPSPDITPATHSDVFGSFPPDRALQAIASSLALPMTAFLIALDKSRYALRWFNPTKEVAICGHATIALAHYLFNVLQIPSDSVQLVTKFYGVMVADKKADGAVTINFPELRGLTVVPPEDEERRGLLRNLGVEKKVEQVVQSEQYWLVELASSVDLKSLKLDFEYLASCYTDKRRQGGLYPRELILTQLAPASHSSTSTDTPDVFTRVVVTHSGFVNEDIATCSAHCCIVPYFLSDPAALERLRRIRAGNVSNTLNVQQLSSRGGRMIVTWKKEDGRVEIASRGVLVKEGQVEVNEG